MTISGFQGRGVFIGPFPAQRQWFSGVSPACLVTFYWTDEEHFPNCLTTPLQLKCALYKLDFFSICAVLLFFYSFLYCWWIPVQRWGKKRSQYHSLHSPLNCRLVTWLLRFAHVRIEHCHLCRLILREPLWGHRVGESVLPAVFALLSWCWQQQGYCSTSKA